MYVKIFSLQKFRHGAINIQNIGVVNLKNPYNHSTEWLFPFDNTDLLIQQKDSFKAVLKDVLANRRRDAVGEDEDGSDSDYRDNDEIDKAVENLRIIIKDPRKEQIDLEEELA